MAGKSTKDYLKDLVTGKGAKPPSTPPSASSSKPLVSRVADEIPPPTQPENLDALLQKINQLRSSIPSNASPTENAPAPASLPQDSPQNISLPPLKEDLALPTKGLVQSFKDAQTASETSFEQVMEGKPKTLLEEYGETKIYRVQDEPLLYYWVPVARPTISERAIINTLKEATTRLISITPYRIRDPIQKRNVYAQQVKDILRVSPELKVPSHKFSFYAEAVVSEMVGYGLIDALIKDDLLEEIMVIGPTQPVYVFHRKYDMMMTNVQFSSDGEIEDIINRIAREIGRRVDISSPLLDARLLDGSRVNATIPPASVSGSTLTVRKFREDPYSLIDLISYKTLNVESAAFLWLCVDGMRTQPANMLISGGTSSGKTTLLNVLCSFIPASERVISIEDTSELNLPLRHWIRLEGRPPGLEGKGEITLDILTKNSLRMRPDRIIVGEVRHNEAFSLFTAMNTGHDGSLGTIHANSAAETLVRVTSPPMDVPQAMLSGLNFVIVENLFHSAHRGSYRRITEISEVTGVIEGKPKTHAVFSWDPIKDELQRSSLPVQYLDRLSSLSGKSVEELEAELKRRERFLQSMVDRGLRDMADVSHAAQQY
ncbi:MAG: CpaF family protein, partial [archaeon]|nr:CpaF family protein [archaeon]